MRLSDFTDPAGNLVATREGPKAFVPAPLPPAIDLAAVAISLSDAMQAIGELRGACRRLQNPYVLIRPLQRQEALTSSAMEGTFTTDDKLLLAKAGVAPEQDDSTTEVLNYIRALDESIILLASLPICHRVILRAHELLLSDLSAARGATKRPGQYKTEQNWIGARTIEAAHFIPPPPASAATCMDSLEAYINRSNPGFPTPLMDLALVHYQIEAIHPFADGNGRVGRMLISLMAVQSGLLDKPVLYVSPVMERWKTEYIDLLYDVSARGRWSEWLSFFFARVAESCRETVVIIDRLLDLQTRLRETAREASRSSNLMTLVDYFFELPALTVTEAARRLGVSYAAANGAVSKLADLGILRAIPET